MSNPNSLLKVLRPVCLPTLNTITVNNLNDIASLRGLHQGQKTKIKKSKKDDFNTKSFRRKFADENAKGDGIEKKRKIDEAKKKVEIKDWCEQSPAWLSRDPDEGDLVKHIEVLQRFAERYNSAYGSLPCDNAKTKTQLSDDGRKRLMKILDKQPSKKFSTFMRAQEKKKKEDRTVKKDKTGNARSFITLANEPRSALAVIPKSKPVVPVIQNFRNPDSILIKSVFGKIQPVVKPRLYSVVNPKFKNKSFEEYVKKTFLTAPDNDKLKEKKVPEATIGEYFSERYTKKPDPEKVEKKSGPSVTAKLQDSLVQGRRTTTSSAKKVQSEPTIHPKTTLLVQKSHLPLTQCKNMRQAGGKSSKTERKSPASVKSAVSSKNQRQALKNRSGGDSLLNRLMNYFKR